MSDDDLTFEQRLFLEMLTEASRATGVIVYGCGCCGSPSLQDAETRTGHYVYEGGAFNGDIKWKEGA